MKKKRSKVSRACIVSLVMLCFLLSALSVSTFAEEYHNIAIIESPDQQSDTLFGFSIDLFENTLVIGESKADIGEHSQAGKVYIYDLDGELIHTLQAPTPQTGGRFGFSVAIKDDVILVGEPGAVVDLYDLAGQVHIYNKDGTLQVTIQSPDPSEWATFGRSLGFNGDNILVGEPDADISDGPYNSGKVHIYDPEGNFLETIVSPEPDAWANFGHSLDGQVGSLVVGEPMAFVDDIEAGRAHVFDSDGNVMASLQSPEPEYELRFGHSVAISGDIVAVSEPNAWTDTMTPNAGKVYVFDNEGNLLVTLQSPNPDASAMFGNSLAMSGDLIIVSEYGADGSRTDEGRAHVFDTEGKLVATFKSPLPGTWDNFGNVVNINEGTIVVQEIGSSELGRVYVYTSGPDPDPDPEPELSIIINSPSNGAELEEQPTLFKVTIRSDGSDVPDASVRFYVDNVLSGDVDSNDNGFASLSLDVSEGSHSWYALAEKTGYMAVTSSTYSFTYSVPEPDPEPSGGIPGFPIESLILSVLLASVMLWIMKKKY